MKTIREEYQELMEGLSPEQRKDTEKIFACGAVLGIEIAIKRNATPEALEKYLIEIQRTLLVGDG